MALDQDPLWYKDAIIYQLHVRAFYDSDGDGIGDFQGLREKLDYLQDLGVTAIWLLPFYPSPLKDDGYDIADYSDVHPSYGSLADFKAFLKEAHKRGLRVITELAINHTSDQHPWFQKARSAKPGSTARDYYVWSETAKEYADARIIFKDFEASNWAWDPVAKAYYWHRFYSHQPDLNFENPRVRKAVIRVMDFWMKMGVDGMRLDAIPYLFEREGTNCENLPETHEFLKELRRHVDKHYKNRMFLAEANQWPEDSVAYLGEGDECHMNFHFPVMPRMFMAVQMEDRFPIIDILKQTPKIPDICQWAMFLRNHDELTLEMVTDEERDYMYRVYAHDTQARINLGIRRRLAPLMSNNRRKLELMNGLLFALPGTPIIYYGDEIGIGDNIYLGDRNGVRTPMQWSPDRNAGFSKANPQKLYLPVVIDPEYHYEAINVEAQQRNPQSLLWWMKRLIALRKQYKAFSRGEIEFLYPENHRILAFTRKYEDETLLFVANLSRFVQYAEIDLQDFEGLVPKELFGYNDFPQIGEKPYFLTMGPHNFYWFSLEKQKERDIRVATPDTPLPPLSVSARWENIFEKENKRALEKLLPAYVLSRRWFGGKANKLKQLSITETFRLNSGTIAFMRAEYSDADTEIYAVPFAFLEDEAAHEAKNERPQDCVASLTVKGKGGEKTGILAEATAAPGFFTELFQSIEKRRTIKGSQGELVASQDAPFRKRRQSTQNLDVHLLGAEQSNTSIAYGNAFIFKLIRKLDEGENPELEIGRFLNEKRTLAHVPSIAGALEYRQGRGPRITVGILQGYIENEGNAWTYTLDSLSRYFEKTMALHASNQEPPSLTDGWMSLVEKEPPEDVADRIETYLDTAALLGRRTAEFHVALAVDADAPDFAPEPFSTLYQRSVYQSMRNKSTQSLQLLSKRLKKLEGENRALAEEVLDREKEIFEIFNSVMGEKFTATRIRTHGDYHLGQVLHTGKDFVIIDFEGEPMRPLSERRIKRSPLRDVAGMIRSLHYAAETGVHDSLERGLIREDARPLAETYARFWYEWTASTFYRAYLAAAQAGDFLPKNKKETMILTNAYMLDKALYEVAYELNNRPDWLGTPLRGVLEMLNGKGK